LVDSTIVLTESRGCTDTVQDRVRPPGVTGGVDAGESDAVEMLACTGLLVLKLCARGHKVLVEGELAPSEAGPGAEASLGSLTGLACGVVRPSRGWRVGPRPVPVSSTAFGRSKSYAQPFHSISLNASSLSHPCRIRGG